MPRTDRAAVARAAFKASFASEAERSAHYRLLGQRSAETREARKAAVERIVRETRRAQGLPDTIEDVEVLRRVADLVRSTHREEAA